ncbi:hypothetical protein M2163_004072 [Streptomyces sp. SAI-135]|nr:hypothetical protein [Streptomyces sp. SAI-135]
MSPQNSATGTTSRKPALAKRFTAAKFAPDTVAVSIRLTRVLPEPGPPPTWKAISRTKGRATRMPNMTRVRRRFNCRTSSTRTGSVRPAR